MRWPPAVGAPVVLQAVVCAVTADAPFHKIHCRPHTGDASWHISLTRRDAGLKLTDPLPRAGDLVQLQAHVVRVVTATGEVDVRLATGRLLNLHRVDLLRSAGALP
jgi:hypothetical protein